MNPYVNEEVMWQRLKDTQREAENRRLVGGKPSLVSVVWTIGHSLWSTTGRAIRSAAVRRPPPATDDYQTAEDVA
jgi:GTPase